MESQRTGQVSCACLLYTSLAIVFMLLYRLPEAFLIKMCMPFLVAGKEAGGLGLSTAEVRCV